jgi:hypothetical protein
MTLKGSWETTHAQVDLTRASGLARIRAMRVEVRAVHLKKMRETRGLTQRASLS